mmetsp:Transcript_19141/g.24630  ORF Transcript_19141/g.24630 Transcript_19141/m.24630 type:complete len:678 (-) Transcript_19141:670-2703(-)|eukprot:CAMPEP_0198154508 /NCGR_PEP_ID=MMETSP1443-20131203/68636_1 /TAXON_ID=186043 /ORGANISM="Entomoneis sp., Strain CCMP2396" /LENGTH=677 /DNA_ID=CAMNT_0043821187 /DNA_START=50 /DNA_END=2083 /DNA_ORIENTATION=+
MSSARKSRSGGRPSKSSTEKSTGEQLGLRQLVQKRILEDVFQQAGEKHPGWKVLIVDEPSMKVLSAAVGMYDIMERKVTIVENLDKKRAPFPDMGAIYLLDPNPASISKMIEDFSGPTALYGDAVFVYLLGRLSNELLDQIKNCRHLLKRIKGLVEINVDFLAKEERAFTLDMRDAFTSFYLRKSGNSVENKIADRLVTVCATLNEYPHIRYKQTSASSTKIANLFKRKMDDFVAQNSTWWYHGGPSKSSSGSAKRDRGVLLLLDRADDCLTPLMHDFTYQSMVHDLLKMDGDRITFQMEAADDANETEAKDVLLDERDKLWVELRGKHIAAVIETLSSRIRDIMSSNTGSNLSGGGGNMSLSQMASALKALPEYREVMSKLSQHMHLSHECMDVFRRESLIDLSELEQTLATGKDDEGGSPKLSDLIDQVDDFLIRIKTAKDRLRLILITTISQGGLRSQDRRRLMNSAELTRKDIRTLNSLELLGLNIFSSSAADTKNKLVSMITSMASAGIVDDDGEYAASRYVPALKPILEQLCTNELSMEDFPSVMPMPDMGPSPASSSARSSRSGRGSAKKDAGASARPATAAASVRKKAGGPSSKWAKSSGEESRAASGTTRFTGGRNIVFMLGGMSYAEIRHVREVSQKMGREIIVGSTDFITADDFLEDLTALGVDEE